MSVHTPGPWHICPQDQASHRWVIAQPDGSSVADCSPVGPWVSDETADANARLTAAAPKLLKALQSIVASLAEHDDEGMIEHAEQMIAARAAIAEATGEQP